MNPRVLVPYRDLDELPPYLRALEDSGMQPVPVEAGQSYSLDDVAGVLLPGGGDVNPARYGELRRTETDAPDDLRDDAECALIDDCLQRDLPLLAICRGLQILNVHLGGSLIQHVPNTDRHQLAPQDRSEPAHAVRLEPDSLLEEIAGRGEWHVNSRHHQAIGRLGEGLRVCARDPEDGTVEAAELPGNRFVLGVQWHPENQAPVDAEQRKLFAKFAAAMTAPPTDKARMGPMTGFEDREASLRAESE